MSPISSRSATFAWPTIVLRSWCLVWLIGWQGGFAFYGGVVVPVGATVMGSELEQGLVTQAVTNWLNAIGGIALVSWLVGAGMTRWQPPPAVRWSAIGVWLAMALGWATLLVLHGQLDQFIDSALRSVTDPDAFYVRHRAYLIISTLQWLGSLWLVAATLLGWQHGDRHSGEVISGN